MAARKPSRKSSTAKKRDAQRPNLSARIKSRTKPGNPRSDRFPIVGIGASAGGFEALQQFFQSIPAKPGVAFIVVQHLDPTRISEMPDLLGRKTKLKVVQAQEGARLEPNVVYTIPSNRSLMIRKGRIQLTMPAEPRGLRLPIDALFRSMAEESEECAIGVVLSGNGADGSLGLKAIKAHGGLGIAQDPATAEYDSMPRNAIATGTVDYVLPPRKMIEAIYAFLDHEYVKRPPAQDGDKVPEHIHDVLALLHARRNVDFSGYKKGTLVRRIDRRMSLRHIARGPAYLELLRENSEEVNHLFNDLLIRVTRFFREPESWKVLERDVLARLVEEADKDNPVRVWVPGCASGEEAYSLAMPLIELVEQSHKNVRIQVFATDLDRGALDQARAGIYPESIAADVSPERLSRFFVRNEHQYVVGQMLREAVVFAEHNLLVDPPFGRLDLISCRNLLIYLEGTTQQRVFDVFHFALKPGRFLCLGNSESVGPGTDLFEPIVKRSKVFRRVGTSRYDRVRPSSRGVPPAPTVPSSVIPRLQSRESTLLTQARDYVLQRYTVACALVNRKMEILSLFGRTENYLTQPSGRLTPEILSWARDGMRTKLRMVIQAAIRKNSSESIAGVRIQRGKRPASISIRVDPLVTPAESDGLFLVLFRDEVGEVSPRGPGIGEPEEPIVRQLEYELQQVRDELQASISQLEASNEELRANNEEILSMNEELQSANEEMETSKEELQSVNEELSAVNTQLEGKLDELQAANDDISNLLTNTDIPVLFLDRKLQVRRFTPVMPRLIRLIGSDLGRPLSDITTLVDDPSLIEDCREVLTSLAPVEKEVRTQDGSGFIRRVMPYRSGDDRIEGVVITYADISDRIRAEGLVREARDFAEGIITTLREPLLVLDETQVIRSANSAFYKTFQLSEDKVVGRSIYEIGNGEWDIPELRRVLETMLPLHTLVTNQEIRQTFSGVGELVVSVNARTLEMGSQRVILVAIEDITHRKDSERRQILRQIMGVEERERHRLALELHDETGQHVTAFLLGLNALKESCAEGTESRTLIDDLKQRAEGLARHLHGVATRLRPTALDEHGLARALSGYLEDVAARHKLDVDFQVEKSFGRLPPEIETVLYRVTQEAMTNVLRHTRSSKVSVVLSRQNGEISLIVEDDGGGFDVEEALNDRNKSRLGLRGMRERVILAGGTFTIESTPGSGTSLFARIPLRSGSHDDHSD